MINDAAVLNLLKRPPVLADVEYPYAFRSLFDRISKGLSRPYDVKVSTSSLILAAQIVSEQRIPVACIVSDFRYSAGLGYSIDQLQDQLKKLPTSTLLIAFSSSRIANPIVYKSTDHNTVVSLPSSILLIKGVESASSIVDQYLGSRFREFIC